MTQEEPAAADHRWLETNEQVAWRKLMATLMLLPAALDAQLQRDSELTHFAYYVLAMLSEAPDRALRMSVLAARSSASPSRLSHTVARLEGRGLVRRHRAQDDGRGQVATLTQDGFDFLLKAAPGHVNEVRRLVFDTIDERSVAALDRVCTQMLSTLDPDGSLISLPPGHSA